MKYEKSDMATQKKSKKLRLIVLIAILIFSTFLGVLHLHPIGSWTPPSVDAFCPFGGIESAFSLVFYGKMLRRMAWSSFTLLFATLIVAFVFKRSFCGNICPMGTLQELFARLGRKFFRKRKNIDPKIDGPLRYLKYIALFVTIFFTWKMGTLVIRPYDPWVAYHHLTSSDLFRDSTVGFIVLILSLAGSLRYDRIFCKYLCPMGAFLALIFRFGWFRVKRNDKTCVHCHICNQVCPVNIPVENGTEVKSGECISCYECVNACPVKDTLFVSGPKNVKLRPSFILYMTLVIFIVVIGVATFTGGFEWKMVKATEKGAEKGIFNPDTITGRDTFEDISRISKIPKQLFMERFKLSEEDLKKPIREIAHRPGASFETEDVRNFVREQLKSK